ncbi:MAG: hypothetical protein AAFZ15_34960, partial [Bacteroidota bacterium]
MKYLIYSSFFLLHFLLSSCGAHKKTAKVPVTVATPLDTTVTITAPEQVHRDSAPWWDWATAHNPGHGSKELYTNPNLTELSGAKSRTEGREAKDFFWDWPTASTRIEFRDSFIHVETTCKERTDTLTLRDTLYQNIDCPCPQNQSQTTKHGGGWWLAAALAFVWLMTFYSK